MKLKRYRIVRDSYAGFEVQIWRIWFPFYVMVGYSNTHISVEKAKEFIEGHKNRVVWKEGKEA